jgi:hypothetical protein
VAVFVYPALKIEGWQQGHAASPSGEMDTITPIRRQWEARPCCLAIGLAAWA